MLLYSCFIPSNLNILQYTPNNNILVVTSDNPNRPVTLWSIKLRTHSLIKTWSPPLRTGPSPLRTGPSLLHTGPSSLRTHPPFHASLSPLGAHPPPLHTCSPINVRSSVFHTGWNMIHTRRVIVFRALSNSLHTWSLGAHAGSSVRRTLA
jgi:hypothetical protein